MSTNRVSETGSTLFSSPSRAHPLVMTGEKLQYWKLVTEHSGMSRVPVKFMALCTVPSSVYVKATEGGKLVFGFTLLEGGNSLACMVYADDIVPDMM